eukprot:gene24999-biopygen2961
MSECVRVSLCMRALRNAWHACVCAARWSVLRSLRMDSGVVCLPLLAWPCLVYTRHWRSQGCATYAVLVVCSVGLTRRTNGNRDNQHILCARKSKQTSAIWATRRRSCKTKRIASCGRVVDGVGERRSCTWLWSVLQRRLRHDNSFHSLRLSVTTSYVATPPP